MGDPGVTHIVCHQSIDGVAFGFSEDELCQVLGRPDKVQQNYTGEVEYLYADRIYRCLANRLVECTVPDVGRFTVNGMAVLSMYQWLMGCEDSVDRAKFRISADQGIAYDRRDPEHGSITIFEKGRWDALLS